MNIVLYDPDYISYSIDVFRRFLVPELSKRIDKLVWVSPSARHSQLRSWLPNDLAVELVDIEFNKSHPLRWISALSRRLDALTGKFLPKTQPFLKQRIDRARLSSTCRQYSASLILNLAFMNQPLPDKRYKVAGILHDLSSDLPDSTLSNIDLWVQSSIATYCASKFTLQQLTKRVDGRFPFVASVVWPSPRNVLDYVNDGDPNPDAPPVVSQLHTLSCFMPATLQERKGHKFLFDAALLALAHQIHLKFVFVGLGTDFLNGSRYPATADEIDLLNYVKRMHALGCSCQALGHVCESTFAELLSRADVVLFPSIYEGFGLPVSEAVMAGLPVIASDLAPIREQLDLFDCHDRVRLVPAGDPHTLALALVDFANGNGPPRVDPAILAAKFKQWTWSKAADAIVSHLSSLLPPSN
jgi:glycosyltransferase involved in cell wall biosynthesis